MESAFVIGGTRFIGRHLVDDLLENGYDVTIFNRGKHDNPFKDADRVEHIEGDRTDDDALTDAAGQVQADVVFDCVAYKPRQVEVAVDVFSDVDAYVYISSGAAYGEEEIPKREGETPLHPCSDEEAVDDSLESYGPRKAEGDRVVFEGAKRGVNAMSVRPCVVYGPYDYTERLDYWIDRVNTYDTIIVPGDGTNIWHRGYVEDVASALRMVAERGEPGEAYNVGDRSLLTLEEMVELVADTLETEVETVNASTRELSVVDLEYDDFMFYRNPPHVLDTSKLADLGWESTPLEEAMERTVEEHLESDRDGSEWDPGRETEERLMEILDAVE
ncbi:MAG: NAD-dependent epimerase/dehydratase family protein [Halobacteria archaeon]|nr:NAD-dependent epimerase/dehydratase family protein [Halobacteria archaeon]